MARRKGGRKKLRWILLALLALILSAGFVPFPLGSSGESPRNEERKARLKPRKKAPPRLSAQERDRLRGRQAALEYFRAKGDWEAIASFAHLLQAEGTHPREKALGREWEELLHPQAASQGRKQATHGEESPQDSASTGNSGFLPTKKRKKVRKAAPTSKQSGQSLGLKKATGR